MKLCLGSTVRDCIEIHLAEDDGTPTGCVVAMVQPDHYQTAGGSMATRPDTYTAGLLAAAPDLLAALRGLLVLLEGESGAGANYWESEPAYTAAVAAIRQSGGAGPAGIADLCADAARENGTATLAPGLDILP